MARDRTAKVRSNSVHLLRDLAVSGGGITCLPTLVCGQALVSGALVPVLADYELPPLELLAIYPTTQRNAIKVTDDEISRAIVSRSQQFPGQEQQVWDYYRKNPTAIASVRAPIYEEKVVDFLLELVKVTDKTVTVEELFKEED